MLALADSSLTPQAQESHSQVVTEDPPATPPRRYKRPTRKLIAGQLPPHLPRIPNISEPTPEERCCKECGGDKKLIGTEHSELLEWVPGGFQVEVTERRKYACRRCQSGVVILSNFKGTLQADGTSTVNKIFDRKNPSPPIRADAWRTCVGDFSKPWKRAMRLRSSQ